MEQYVTGNVATNLYWLGRYLQRTEITLGEIISTYDDVIDIDKSAGVKLYEKFDIELKYENAYGFLEEAIFGDHNANLLNILTYARENAIICRHLLDSEAFGEIIALHGLFLKTQKNNLEVDYKLIEHAQSLFGVIWNAMSKREDQEISDAFFRIGKLVEEADYRIRFNENNDEEVILSLFKKIDGITQFLTQDHDEEPKLSKDKCTDKDECLNELNEKIDKIIVG